MSRRKRRESATGVYHVVVRGINKEKIFAKEKDCRKMYKTMHEYLKEDLEIYAYCIMPNHLHLMIKGDLKVIIQYMSKIEIAYAAYYNLSRVRNGHVFQDRFKSECIEEESYFWNCLNYIHANPVKAGLVKVEDEYEYSSFNEVKSEKLDLINEKTIRLKKKNPERFGKMSIYPGKIIADTVEEELIQKEEYFIEQLEIYANSLGETSQTVADISKLRKQFIEFEYQNNVLSKNLMLKLFEQFRK